MAKWLKADGTTGVDSFAYKLLGTGSTGLQELYVELEVYLCQSQIDEGGTPDLFEVFDLYSAAGLTYPQKPKNFVSGNFEGLFLNGLVPGWSSEADGDLTDTVAAGSHIIQLHIKKTTTQVFEYKIDGTTYTLTASDLSGYITRMNAFAVGNFFSNGNAADVNYITSVKLGTSGYGSTDIFSDDFSTGDTSAWDGSIGLCSVVNTPCIDNFGVIFRTRYGNDSVTTSPGSAPSASLIGGLSAGPVASGSGTGTTLTLTLTDDITSNCLLYFMWGAGTFGVFDSAAGALNATDSFGNTWTVSSGTKALIGYTNESDSSPLIKINLGSALALCGEDDLSSGDSITLNWDASGLGHPSSLETVGMVFAITNVLDTATSGWHFYPGGSSLPGPQYGQGLSYNTFSSDPKSILYLRDLGVKPSPDADCAIIVGLLGTPTLGTVTPDSAIKIGTANSTNMTLSTFLFPNVSSGDIVEPGASWANNSTRAVINYQGIDRSNDASGVIFNAYYRWNE